MRYGHFTFKDYEDRHAMPGFQREAGAIIILPELIGTILA